MLVSSFSKQERTNGRTGEAATKLGGRRARRGGCYRMKRRRRNFLGNGANLKKYLQKNILHFGASGGRARARSFGWLPVLVFVVFHPQRPIVSLVDQAGWVGMSSGICASKDGDYSMKWWESILLLELLSLLFSSFSFLCLQLYTDTISSSIRCNNNKLESSK